ncbi:hypothetical protein [Nocardia cyriacigeorgica]|nr:hypothetical protein [Nocardia cyriacigeorgica]
MLGWNESTQTFVRVAELAHTSARVPHIDYAEWRADMDAMIDQGIPGRE